jgi:hypothetical protein
MPAKIQLAICEGSDWFWWFGDYNPGGLGLGLCLD